MWGRAAATGARSAQPCPKRDAAALVYAVSSRRGGSMSDRHDQPRLLGRRSLLRAGVASGASLAFAPVVATAAKTWPAAGIPYEEATIVELQSGMASGRFTAR